MDVGMKIPNQKIQETNDPSLNYIFREEGEVIT